MEPQQKSSICCNYEPGWKELWRLVRTWCLQSISRKPSAFSLLLSVNGTIVGTPGDGTKSMSLGAHIESLFFQLEKLVDINLIG